MTDHNRRRDDGEKSAVLVHLEYIRESVDALKKAVFGLDESGGLKIKVGRLEQANRRTSRWLIFVGAPVLVIVLHRKNIDRLRAGTESKIGSKKKAS